MELLIVLFNPVNCLLVRLALLFNLLQGSRHLFARRRCFGQFVAQIIDLGTDRQQFSRAGSLSQVLPRGANGLKLGNNFVIVAVPQLIKFLLSITRQLELFRFF